MVEFKLLGDPVPQGSVSAFVVGGRAKVTNRNEKILMPFRQAIASAAEDAGVVKLEQGPVYVELEFVLKRPQAHYGTGRNAGVPKAWAPTYVPSSPDVDKLTRAVLDGLDGTAFRDDGQVAVVHAEKRYVRPGEAPHTAVHIDGLAEEGRVASGE